MHVSISLFSRKTGAFCTFVYLQINFSKKEYQNASQKIASYSRDEDTTHVLGTVSVTRTKT